MRTKCEIAVHDIFPVARSLLAKKLIEGYGLSQVEASKRMGISQPAISQYKTNIRGSGRKSFRDSPAFKRILDDIA